jgi:hypothetical protein
MKHLLVPAFALACAASHAHHGHMHVHQKRDVVQEKISVTVVECWLGGAVIPEADCERGIANGTLKWADDGSLVVPGTSTAYTTSVSSAAKVAPASSTSVAAKATPVAPVVQAYANTPSGSDASSVNKQFPDGQLACSHFPSDYGAVSTDWLNLGGWASVQVPSVTLPLGYSNIMDMTQSQCSNGNCCVEGSFCSYACPEGYLKYQWPALQGLTGQSIGGVFCQGGKLHLSNPSVKTLCAVGSTQINVQVQNKLSQEVAICRTNYPGKITFLRLVA